MSPFQWTIAILLPLLLVAAWAYTVTQLLRASEDPFDLDKAPHQDAGHNNNNGGTQTNDEEE